MTTTVNYSRLVKSFIVILTAIQPDGNKKYASK